MARRSAHGLSLTAILVAAGFLTAHLHGAPYSGTPFSGTPAAVPGNIPAANFDNGGEGVAYHDNSSGNAGGAYRATDVDLAASSEGGYTVGWISGGEWANYTVNVTASGSYVAQIRVASPSGGGLLHIGFNNSPGTWTAVAVPATGGWQTWTTVNVPLTLVAGTQQMTLLYDNGGYNVSYVNVAAGSGGGGGGTPSGGGSLSPYGGTAAAVPGTIQAANFDNGGEGLAYHDNSTGNAGGAYRQTDVDLASSTEGGYTIGWIGAGEWVNYSVNVATAGSYTAQIRVAGYGGTMHIGLNKSTGSWTQVNVPSTGGWQTWTTVSVPLTLSAGTQQMTLMFDTGGYNVSYVTMASGTTTPPAAPPPSGGSSTLRMLTWNIHAGKDVNNAYALTNQLSWILSQAPDVMVFQEVQTYDENQPVRIPQILQQLSGQTWYSVWAPGTGCASGGCIGELIVSRIPIQAQNSTYLGPSSAGRALIYVNGVPINIFTNHLEYYDTNLRTSELNQLMSWARSFGGPRLIGGDFNSWWGEWWILQMETEYHDTWFDFARSQEGALTTGNVRFDYIFRSFDGDTRVTPTNAFVPWTTLSDHRPFIADYRVQ